MKNDILPTPRPTDPSRPPSPTTLRVAERIAGKTWGGKWTEAGPPPPPPPELRPPKKPKR